MHLLTHIKQLCVIRESQKPIQGKELRNIQVLSNAYLLIEGEHITSYGRMSEAPTSLKKIPKEQRYDLTGRYVLPAFCDSHTHVVFVGNREKEFVDRLLGKSYEEIASEGGGILRSAEQNAAASEDQLFVESYRRIKELVKMGTGAIEIKSGYGLTEEEEYKILRVINRIRDKAPIPVRTTYLALHALPKHFERKKYIENVCTRMVPRIAKEKWADYVDVFCETSFFDAKACEQVLQASRKYGLKCKLHAEQLSQSGGVRLGVDYKATSVDHLENVSPTDVSLLGTSPTFATLLPNVSFFLKLPYAPAKALVASNARLALASDYNPGSSPAGNMQFVLALASTQMGLLPEEALQAATFNGACAMECQDRVGSIAKGKLANLLITKNLDSLAALSHHFSHNCIDAVMVRGDWYVEPTI